MGRKLDRANDAVDRAERKLLLYQQQLKAATEYLKQVENDEIVRAVRSLHLDRHGLADLMRGIEEGRISLPKMTETKGNDAASDDAGQGTATEQKAGQNEECALGEAEKELKDSNVQDHF